MWLTQLSARSTPARPAQAARAPDADLTTRLANIEAGGAGRAAQVDAMATYGAPAIVEQPQDAPSFGLANGAAAGVSTIDMVDNSSILAGDVYFLVEGATIEQIKISSVLSQGQVTLTAPLANSFTVAASLSRYDGASNLISQHIPFGFAPYRGAWSVSAKGNGPYNVDSEQGDGSWLQALPRGAGFLIKAELTNAATRFRTGGVAPTDIVAAVPAPEIWLDQGTGSNYEIIVSQGVITLSVI